MAERLAGVSHADVVVVGAGIIGCTVALELARSGRQVVQCAHGASGDATQASGAMLGVLGEVSTRDSADALRVRVKAATRHELWRAALGIEAGFGTFVVASGRRASDIQGVAAMETAAKREGIRCSRVDAEEVHGFRPANGWAPARVLHLPDEGWIDALQLMEALNAALGGHPSITSVPGRVVGVARHGDRASGVLLESGLRVQADEVVLCAGANVAELTRASGWDSGVLPPTLPSKGVGLRLRPRRDAPALGVALRTPNREFACGLHAVPRGDSTVYVGATNRVSQYVEMLGAVTAGEVSLLLGQAMRELDRELVSAELVGTGWGVRPLSVDGVPIVGRTAIDGLSVATGTYRDGVLLAPMVADAVAADLDRSTPHPEENPWSPARTVNLPDANAVLRDGLAEMGAQLVDGEDLAWDGVLAPLLSALGAAAFSGPEGLPLREHVSNLIRRYPRAEMVPECVIELLQEFSHQR